MLSNLPSDICPVCGSTKAQGCGSSGDLVQYQCDICGPYFISAPAAFSIHPNEETGKDFDPHRYKLACHIRRRFIEGKQPPTVLLRRKGPNALAEGAIGIDDIREMRSPSRAERLDHTLLNLASLSSRPGRSLPRGTLPWSAGYAEDDEVLNFLFAELEEAGHVKAKRRTANEEPASEYRLTSKGWNRVAELQSGPPSAKPRQAFVAMSFAPDFRAAYDDGIRPGIEAAGYDALRMDDLQHSDLIDNRMLAEIRQSRFLVADLSHANAGAYFEAGFARGLGLPVIYTLRDGEACHFDTNHYPHIPWKTHEELSKELRYRILATIGPPSE